RISEWSSDTITSAAIWRRTRSIFSTTTKIDLAFSKCPFPRRASIKSTVRPRVRTSSKRPASLKLIHLILTAHLPKQSRIILQHFDSVRMLWAERAPIERLGLGVSPLRIVECRQVVEAVRSVRMLWAERFLSDVERALAERLSLGILRALIQV